MWHQRLLSPPGTRRGGPAAIDSLCAPTLPVGPERPTPCPASLGRSPASANYRLFIEHQPVVAGESEPVVLPMMHDHHFPLPLQQFCRGNLAGTPARFKLRSLFRLRRTVSRMVSHHGRSLVILRFSVNSLAVII